MSEEINKPEENFETIDKDNQKYIKRICSNNSITVEKKVRILMEHFGEEEEIIRKRIAALKINISNSQFAEAKLKILKKSNRYIISSAQAGSPVNENFLKNIKAYANHIGAEIGIIATRYKNPTSIFKEEGDVWDSLVDEYLTASRQYLNKKVLLLGDLKIQATSPNPTNGIELFGGDASVIVGSPRIELRVVPTLPNSPQKFLYSTGTVTAPNFTDSVAGGKASEHHTYGFVIVETDEDNHTSYIRSVSADLDGNFNDLIFRVENEVISNEYPEYFVWGDSHFAQKDQAVTDAFRKLCSDLNIKVSVLHDVWDSCSVNPHNLRNPLIQHKLNQDKKDSLKRELNQMYKELEWFNENMEATIVVASNHDDMLTRVLATEDWKNNIKNAKIFVKLLHTTLTTGTNNIIAYKINKRFDKITALDTNSSYKVFGVELALHGHKGPNGAKGNINSFAKLSTKSIIGHSHSPGIKAGCYQVGVSCRLDHDYNSGLSSWAYAGVTLNSRGKRQLIILDKITLTYTTLY